MTAAFATNRGESMTLNRRHAFRRFAAFLAASPLARAQRDIPYTAERLPALEDLVNVFEFEPLCKYRIPKQNYDFIAGGVDNEWTLRRNRDAFDRILLRPRMLVDTSKMDLSLTLYGEKIGMPILIAPTAGHQLAHTDGELATARAAAATKTIICLSSNSSYPMDKVSEASPGPKWWQLYPREDVEASKERVLRAVDAGYKAIVVTVDAPYNSHRERLLHNRQRAQVPSGGAPQRRRRADQPPHPYRLEPTLVASLDWTFVEKVRSWVKVPVLVKGVLTAEDAELCLRHGASGMVVSNHGGRYLEYAPASIEVLPEIISVVKGKMPVLVDSGFRRGTDILKALAVGATAVLVGRPPLWGLGAFGQPGVERVLQLLETELALAMGLCGKPNLKAIDSSLLMIDKRG
jgi:isopentenyl diphosphate isomerase/L-lactate dehydrogenase-like FMN-dependent dehydrogenase